jgi:hypothetical protein
MKGVTQPAVPPRVFVMFGRKIVVAGVPGVPHAPERTADEVSPVATTVLAIAPRGAPTITSATK